MRNIGTTELLFIAFVVLFLFGGKKIPEFIRGLGQAINEFKKASKS
jgi:sec-independent protein translocase protein TatA